MKHLQKRKAKGRVARSILRVAQRGIATLELRHDAIDEFVEWYLLRTAAVLQQDSCRSVS